MEHIVHPLDPVYDDSSRVLILGSLPSPLSRSSGFYYGNPRNRFWQVLSVLLEEPLPSSNEEKRQLLISHHIALWDVIRSCDIHGAADSSIRDVVVNDIPLILSSSCVRAVFANGSKAYELYMRYCYPDTRIEAVKLPSTSPANAASSLDRLVEEYRKIMQFL